MGVRQLEPRVDIERRTGESEPDLDPALAAEWIDPDGDDWLASIYSELAGIDDPASAADPKPVELVPWFG